MTALFDNSQRCAGHVLLVDSDTQYIQLVRDVFVSEGYLVTSASLEQQALDVVERQRIDAVVVDDSWLTTAGEGFLLRIRQLDSDVRIILQTAAGDRARERDLLQRLNLNGLVDKADGPERLLLWTEVAFKAAHAARTLRSDTSMMKRVVEAAAGFHRLQSFNSLAGTVVSRVCECLRASAGLLVLNQEMLDSVGEPQRASKAGGAVVIASENWPDADRGWPQCGDTECQQLVQSALRDLHARTSGITTVLPLVLRETCLGFVCLRDLQEGWGHTNWLELLRYQASVALQNGAFYEMAAFDPLSGLYARRFFENWAQRELHAAVRNGTSCAFLFVDLDGLKKINDGAGHAAGDKAIRVLGAVLRTAIREHDIVGRIGGDEFGMLMPCTREEGATHVGQRIVELLRAEPLQAGETTTPLTASIGISLLRIEEPCNPRVAKNFGRRFYEDVFKRLVARADESLYYAKTHGGDRSCVAAPLEFRDISGPMEARAGGEMG